MKTRKFEAMRQAARTKLDEAEALIGEDGTVSAEAQPRYEALLAESTRLNEQAAQLAAAFEADRNAPAVASWTSSSAGMQEAPKAGGSFHVTEHAESRPWSSMGEFLQAVAVAMSPHGGHDPRLGPHAAASGASVGEAAAGGFLMQTAYSEALLDRAREESPILGMCRSIPIPTGMESIDLPVIDESSRATGSRWGGVQVYRIAEADTVTAKRPLFGKLKIDSSQIMGLAYATDRLLRNEAALATIFEDAFASEFAFKVTNEIIRGGGGDECLGVLSAANPATVSQAKETGQAAATIVVENLSKMWAHVPARSKSRGVWLINNDVEPALDKLYIAAGASALEPRFITYDAQGAIRIKGRPVMQIEQCETLGTVGDIIFADFNEYIVAPQGGIEGAQSMHVRFIYSEMTFRWSYYINGRPAWLTSLTPFKGSTSLSPFVTLATRS